MRYIGYTFNRKDLIFDFSWVGYRCSFNIIGGKYGNQD